MLGGFTAITKEYLQLSAKISGTRTKVNSEINICRIDNVNSDKLTVDVFLPDTNVYFTNVPISFSSKGYGYGSYFMPKKGQLALIFLTSYGRKYVLATSNITDNKLDQNILEGENLLLSYGGAYLKQDTLGNSINSSSSGNMNFNGSNLLNSELSAGKEERTLSSNSVKGLAFDVNKIANSIIKNDNIKLVNYEEYYNNVSSIKTYEAKDIIINGNINQVIKNEILNNANDVIMKITSFAAKNSDFSKNISFAENDRDKINIVKENFAQDIKTNFRLSKNTSLIIQKGNVVTKRLETVNDIYDLTEGDFVKSPDGNDVSFKMSVLDPLTKEEVSYIMIDSKGNGYMKFKKLQVETEDGLIHTI